MLPEKSHHAETLRCSATFLKHTAYEYIDAEKDSAYIVTGRVAGL